MRSNKTNHAIYRPSKWERFKYWFRSVILRKPCKSYKFRQRTLVTNEEWISNLCKILEDKYGNDQTKKRQEGND